MIWTSYREGAQYALDCSTGAGKFSHAVARTCGPDAFEAAYRLLISPARALGSDDTMARCMRRALEYDTP